MPFFYWMNFCGISGLMQNGQKRFFWYLFLSVNLHFLVSNNAVINWVRVFLVVFRLFVTLTLIFCSKNSILINS